MQGRVKFSYNGKQGQLQKIFRRVLRGELLLGIDVALSGICRGINNLNPRNMLNAVNIKARLVLSR